MSGSGNNCINQGTVGGKDFLWNLNSNVNGEKILPVVLIVELPLPLRVSVCMWEWVDVSQRPHMEIDDTGMGLIFLN